MSTWKTRLGGSLVVLTLTLSAAHGGAQDRPRVVVVNGQLLGAAELAFVDMLNCGRTVPDGVYWLNLAKGIWGSVGTPGYERLPSCVQARASTQRQQAAPRPRASSSSSVEAVRYRSALDHVSNSWGTTYSDPAPR